MQKRGVFLIFLIFLFSSDIACAEILREFYQSTRAIGMGNAFTAVSDDADAVFYNPAGLSLNRKTKFTFFNPKIEASKDDFKLISSASSTFSKFDASAIQGILGKHIYANASIFPNIQIPNFILGFLYAGTVRMYARNASYPQLSALYLRDYGLVGGFGYEVEGIAKRHWLRFGTSLKWINRQGMDKTLSIAEIITSDKSFYKKQIKGPSSGVGLGLGLQYEIFISKFSDLIIATSWQDIGDTNFQGDENGKPPSIQNNLAAGAAYRIHFKSNYEDKSGFIISAEARHLMQEDIDPRLRAHLGLELRFDAGLLGEYALRAGISDAAPTVGVGWNFKDFLALDAAAYSVENTSVAFKDREQRYLVQFSFSLEVFNRNSRTSKQNDRKYYPRNYQ